MSRSVSRPSDAAVTVFSSFFFDDDEFEAMDQAAELISDLRSALRSAFPTVNHADRWLDREDHVIASNKLADFGVSEYMGLYCIWAVPDPLNRELGLQWLANIEPKLRRVVRQVFGTELRHIGTACNGEAFFEEIAA